MSPRTLLCASIALATGVPVAAHPAAAQSRATQARLESPRSATVGLSMPIACFASDPEGVARIAIKVTAPEGTTTVLGAAFGAESARAQWTPSKEGAYIVSCLAAGASAPGASATTTAHVDVARSSVVPASVPETAPVAAPWTAAAGASAYEGALPARMSGPRRIAAAADGMLFVVDREGRLHRLTARGELMATQLKDVTAVAAGPAVVFAGLRQGAVVVLDARSGRIVRRIELGTSEGPVGLAFDAARGNLWLAFGSGMLQARTADGKTVHRVSAAGKSALGRLVDVAVDAQAGIVWVARDRADSGSLLRAFDATSGKYLRSVGGSGPGEIRLVGGLTVAGGRVYVSDLFSGNVQVLDAAGAVVQVIGRRGEGAGELSQPAGLAFLANGDLVVASMDANRLERFGNGAALPVCPGDADCDGLPDAWEAANGLDRFDPKNALADTDGDGLTDAEEYALGSNPRSSDTNGDGTSDGDALAAGKDPKAGLPEVLVDVPPVADPGVVQLAAQVNDPGNHGGCAVTWRQIAGPQVSLKAASLDATFIARRGTFRFEAVAACGAAKSQPAPVEVTVRNLPPRVDGGRLATVASGATLVLSGARSTDANGDALAFGWDQVLGAPVIAGGAGEAVSARFAAPGYYVFRVGASDQKGGEGEAEVPVLVLGAGGAPTAVASTPVLARAGESVVLDASGSYRAASASFQWRQVAGPAVSLDAAASDAPSFVPPAPGRYAFEVAVVDGQLRSPPARVEVYAADLAGVLPAARASAPAVVAVNTPVTLDGSASAAGSGRALGYAWRQVSGPAAGLNKADRSSAIAVAFEPGSYEFELTVDDGIAVGVPARVRFEARAANKPIPVAAPKAAGTAIVGQLVFLDGRDSTGAKHRWTQVDGPWVAVEQGAVARFQPTAPGVYAFELEVEDGRVRSAPARVTVMVFPNGTEN